MKLRNITSKSIIYLTQSPTKMKILKSRLDFSRWVLCLQMHRAKTRRKQQHQRNCTCPGNRRGQASRRLASPALSKLNAPTAGSGASQVAPAVKNLPVNAADPGSTPGSGRSPAGGSGHPLQYLVWEIPRTEESGGLQSKGSQKSWTQLSD